MDLRDVGVYGYGFRYIGFYSSDNVYRTGLGCEESRNAIAPKRVDNFCPTPTSYRSITELFLD